MTKPKQVAKRELRGAGAIEHDVRNPGERSVGGDGDRGRSGWFREARVDGQDAFNAPRVEQARVLGDEVRTMAMVRGEEEVALAHQNVGGAGEDLRVVALAEHGKEDANGARVGAAQGARDEIGAVAELARGSLDALARDLRDGAVGRIVKDKGDRCRREIEVFGEHLERDACAGRRRGFLFRHGWAVVYRRAGSLRSKIFRRNNLRWERTTYAAGLSLECPRQPEVRACGVRSNRLQAKHSGRLLPLGNDTSRKLMTQ